VDQSYGIAGFVFCKSIRILLSLPTPSGTQVL
jgi:hypothetical protein